MAAAETHRPAAKIVIPDTPGMHGYFTTVCGLRLDAGGIAISDDKANVTCAKCKAKR